MAPLTEPRRLSELRGESSGQLVTEWVLVTAVIVIPLILTVPRMLETIRTYFYRTAEVICFPFP